MKYRVLVGVNYPTEPAILKRLYAGEDIPREDRHEVRHEPGEIVDDVPPKSVKWLVEQGVIAPEDGE